MDKQIQSGVVLITGAASGLGQAMAIRFAVEGCRKLFLVDLNMAGLEDTKTLIEARILDGKADIRLHVTNVGIADEVRDMVAACVQHFERLDFAINNAGIARGGVKTAEMDIDMFDRTCQTNQKGNFLCQKYAIRQMLKQEPLAAFDAPLYLNRNTRGCIVNTASICGLVTLRDFAAYTSSKHAVAAMTKQTAREYAPAGIRINAVCPGTTETPGVAAANLTPEFKAGLKRQAPINRFMHADEIAGAVVFLCSSSASAITGVNLPVDGGATLYHYV